MITRLFIAVKTKLVCKLMYTAPIFAAVPSLIQFSAPRSWLRTIDDHDDASLFDLGCSKYSHEVHGLLADKKNKDIAAALRKLKN